ncbi:MAG: cysteine hydrolase [Candidatus Makaraimicrobium thalassicum]|nr:MAG: cysteine hydrolase [Candidatus Omnitrophota bacterium]
MSVLLVIDMLRDFMTEEGALYCGDNARRIIPFIARKIDECRSSGCKVIHVCDSHRPDDREFSIFPAHCVKGTRGAESIEELKPVEQDIVIEKTRYSAFYGTELEKALKELDPETVFVSGVCTSICVMDTVGGLRDRDYRVVVYKQGVADFDAEAHEFALKRMADVYGAEVK